MAESSPLSVKPPIDDPQEPRARHPSMTRRLMGASREWIEKYYRSAEEEEDQAYNQSLKGQMDDGVPNILNKYQERRRTCSVSSAGSDDGPDKGVLRSSIGEQVNLMNLKQRSYLPGSSLETFEPNIHAVIDN